VCMRGSWSEFAEGEKAFAKLIALEAQA